MVDKYDELINFISKMDKFALRAGVVPKEFIIEDEKRINLEYERIKKLHQGNQYTLDLIEEFYSAENLKISADAHVNVARSKLVEEVNKHGD